MAGTAAAASRRRPQRVSMQEHMAIDVSPGPIRPIHLISHYFPHFYPFSEPALRTPDPHPAVAPTISSAPQLQPDPEPEGDSDDSSEWGRGQGGRPRLSTAKVGYGQPRRLTERGKAGGMTPCVSGGAGGVQVGTDPACHLPLAALGTLEFTLLFDADNSALHCTAHRAKVRMGTGVPGPWA